MKDKIIIGNLEFSESESKIIIKLLQEQLNFLGLSPEGFINLSDPDWIDEYKEMMGVEYSLIQEIQNEKNLLEKLEILSFNTNYIKGTIKCLS